MMPLTLEKRFQRTGRRTDHERTRAFPSQQANTLNPEDRKTSDLLRPFWGRFGIAPWHVSPALPCPGRCPVMRGLRSTAIPGPVPTARAGDVGAAVDLSQRAGSTRDRPFQAAQMAAASGAERDRRGYCRLAVLRCQSG